MSHSPRSISLETAQTLAVVKQGLHQRPESANKESLLKTIRQMGLLQLDSVSVVARSHYLVMLSRMGLYDRADLDALLYPDRALFEQWAHAACLIPAEDYPYFAPVILARREGRNRYFSSGALGDEPQALADQVLAEVEKRGPLSSKDFEDPRQRRGSWWDHKPAKYALNYLYDRGYLMVAKRVNFQIYYDLAARVLPVSAEPPAKTIEDHERWATLRSIGCLGVATARQVNDYYRRKVAPTRKMIAALEAEGAIVPVTVEGWADQAYIDPADLSLIDQIESGQCQPTLTTFLSPFDNLTWNRTRLKDLFDFDYTIEIYTPAAKRKYGYYVLPILHRGRYVGRLDPKADRANKTLIIHAIHLEPGVAISDGLVNGIVPALREFMIFHNCERVSLGFTDPAGLKETLLAQIDFQ